MKKSLLAWFKASSGASWAPLLAYSTSCVDLCAVFGSKQQPTQKGQF